MDLFEQNVAIYNVVDAMCLHRRSQNDMEFRRGVSAMTCIVERRAFNERLYAVKSQYVAEFIVLTDNFVACYLISMSIGPLASYRR